MATVEYRLSKRVNAYGKSEVTIRLNVRPDLRPIIRTGVFVKPEFFRKVGSTGHGNLYEVSLPRSGKFNIADKEEVSEAREVLHEIASHLVVVCDRMESAGKGDKLTREFIENAYALIKDKPVSDVSYDLIDHSHAKRVRMQKQEEVKTMPFFEMCLYFLEKTHYSEGRIKTYKVLFRALGRYEAYVRATDIHRRSFRLSIDTIDKRTIEDFFDYMAQEHELAHANPKLFEEKILPFDALNEGRKFPPIAERGANVLTDRKKAFKAFFHWLQKNDYTTNDPFLGITIGSARYGTPYYINIEERKAVANADLAALWQEYAERKRKEAMEKGEPFKLLPLSTCQTQRDIFIFQCLIGCRVGDLMKMTKDNITDGVLNYIPRKTIDERPFVVKVPLLPEALTLIEKYKGKDASGRLFPFISSQRYNDAIKEILEMCGITRMVTVRDSLTGDEKQVRICDVASSHMARRTFIGNLYKKVKDPNIVGSMSGHVEGSQAFTRYREVDMDIKQDVIKELE